MTGPPEALFRRWVRVPEEDTADASVYRPAGQRLPPARVRDGIEFRADGTFVDWRPGPVDAPVASAPGQWTSEGPDRVRLRRTADRTEVVFQIVAVSDQLLQLRPVAAG